MRFAFKSICQFSRFDIDIAAAQRPPAHLVGDSKSAWKFVAHWTTASRYQSIFEHQSGPSPQKAHLRSGNLAPQPRQSPKLSVVSYRTRIPWVSDCEHPITLPISKSSQYLDRGLFPMQVQIKLEIVHNSHFWIEYWINHNPKVC